MSPEILIVRDRHGFRLLHGYLHLTSTLMLADEARVHVRNDGEVRIVKGRHGFLVSKGRHQWVLLCR